MYYSRINKHDIANGDGVRVSLWVSGCEQHCKGCFNKETWNFYNGRPYDIFTAFEIVKALEPEYISGLTILGGEPLHHKNVGFVGQLLKMVRYIYGDTKTIWIYTGYIYEDIKELDLLKYVDVLVDGPFIEEEKDIRLKFRGSRNQRILYLKEENT